MTDSINFDLLLPFSVPIACSNIPLDLTELEKLIVDMSKTDPRPPTRYLREDGGWHSKEYNEPFDEIRLLKSVHLSHLIVPMIVLFFTITPRDRLYFLAPLISSVDIKWLRFTSHVD